MKRIGLSPCFMYPDPKRAVFGPKTLTYFENDMIRYIGEAGFKVELIPLLDDFSSLELDGLVLQGGSDIAPETYHEEPLGQWEGDRFRDEYELKLIDWAVKNKMSIFGICRGFQLINVYFGGTLYQDIPTQKELALTHRDAEKYDTLLHTVEVKPGGFLSHVYPNTIRVNTVHHQAIKELAQNLRVEAVSSKDGIIEAFSADKILGVQWHPEFSHTLGSEVADPKVLLKYLLTQEGIR